MQPCMLGDRNVKIDVLSLSFAGAGEASLLTDKHPDCERRLCGFRAQVIQPAQQTGLAWKLACATQKKEQNL